MNIKITNFYFNGRCFHIDNYGSRILVDTIQGTKDLIPGIRTDNYFVGGK